jgi:hypothetical protein
LKGIIMIASWIARRRHVGTGRWRPAALLAAGAAAGLLPALLTGTGTAQAAASPAPAPGMTPAIALFGYGSDLAYVATDGSAWMESADGTPIISLGGHLTAGPALMTDTGTSLIVFGRGTDNALWMDTVSESSTGEGWTSTGWTSLGGAITASPSAVLQGPTVAGYTVYARGTDGVVWYRTHAATGWGAWHSLGGRLLAGTGPSAALLNGSTYVLVTGTNRELYLAEAGTTGFSPAGGLTTASPGLAATPEAPAAFVGVARGTDGVAYYHQFLASSPGWHPMGGKFTSGLAVTAQYKSAGTETAGLGTDGRIWDSSQDWSTYPPALSPWTAVP